MIIQIVNRGSMDWLHSAELACTQYRKEYGAQIDPSPDAFITYQAPAGMVKSPDCDHSILACIGMTRHSSEPFFSECYLDRPVDWIIERREGTECPRQEIAELGALASCAPRAGAELIKHLPVVAWCHGLRYVLLTVTTQVARYIDRVGISFNVITTADPARLDRGERHRWGTYYDQSPVTGYVDLTRTLAYGERIYGLGHLGDALKALQESASDALA